MATYLIHRRIASQARPRMPACADAFQRHQRTSASFLVAQRDVERTDGLALGERLCHQRVGLAIWVVILPALPDGTAMTMAVSCRI